MLEDRRLLSTVVDNLPTEPPSAGAFYGAAALEGAQVAASSTIGSNPVSATTDVGFATPVTFTASATGDPTPTVKWQVDTGSGFADLANGGVYSGVTTTTLTVTGATLGMNGYQYRAVFSNGVDPDVQTSAATLTVNPALAIAPTSMPSGLKSTLYHQTITVSGGTTPYTTFTVNSFNAGSTGLTSGAIVANATTGTLAIDGTPTGTGSVSFTVNVTDTVGATLAKDYVIAVNQAPSVTTHPANAATDAGLTTAVTFTAAAEGNPTPTVKWQVNAGSGFTDLANGGVYSGVTTTTLTVTGATLAMNGYTYRAVFTNGLGTDATTNAATLTVNAAPSIAPATLPSGTRNTLYHQTINVTGGTTPYTTFTVTGFSAGGTGLTSSAIVTNASAGTIVVDGTPTAAGAVSFTVNVVDTAGATLTEDYSIAINQAPAVTAAPHDVTTDASTTTIVTFTAAAVGTPAPAVRWQVNTGSGFTDLANGGVYSGVTTTTLTLTGSTVAMNGYQYRAIFSNGISPDAPTDAATLTVNPAMAMAPVTLPIAITNLTYHQTITVSGGTRPYTAFSVNDFNAGGTGLSSSAIVTDAAAGTVVINGVPTATGTVSFAVNVMDSVEASIIQNYTITVKAPNGRPSVLITTPTGAQSGNITITYKLSDVESDVCGITVLYSLNGGTTWSAATAATGGDGVAELTSSPTGVTHTYVWASDKDIVNANSSTVQISILPSDFGGNGVVWTSDAFTVNNHTNQRPSAFVPTPVGTQKGTVAISYSLSDLESDTCSVQVEYSPNGGVTWYAATRATGGEGTTGLTSGTGGASHVFLWASGTDMSNVSSSDVRIRITPSDSLGSGTPGVSSAFTVDNFVNFQPLAIVTTPSSPAGGTIVIHYTLADGNFDNCSVAVMYYRNGIWCMATAAMGQGDGTTNLATTPTGVSHTFVWASDFDLPNSDNTNMQVSVVPYDSNGVGCSGTTAMFDVINRSSYATPALARVGIGEANGRHDGRLETDEKLVMTWVASSPYRIVSQSIIIDGRTFKRIVGPSSKIYYSCEIGRWGAGVHNYAIGATNSRGMSYSIRGSFMVNAILPPLIDLVVVTGKTMTWAASSWYGIKSQTLTVDGRKVSSIRRSAGSFYYYANIGYRSAGVHTYVITTTDNRNLKTTKAGTFTIGSALMVDATSTPEGSAAELTDGELASVTAEAIRRVTEQVGSGSETVLAGVNFRIADLPVGQLGEAAGKTVTIDRSAAGYGWFVDPTPEDDLEFVDTVAAHSLAASDGSGAVDRADLLTTVMHELEHVLGKGHSQSLDLMSATLPLGTRRLAVD